jgi:hypothetical protein
VRIAARTRSAAGVIGPIQMLSSAQSNANNVQVAMDIGGAALVVWQFGFGPTRIQGAIGP